MRVIGITGCFGTGKSTVATIFKQHGAKVLSADTIAHQLIAPGGACFRPIVRAFGEDVLRYGKIDRQKVSELVFRDLKQLKKLERIIHPAVRRVLINRIQQLKKRRRKSVIVVDVPLLFEARLKSVVDISIVVKTTRTTQMKRAIKKYGMTKMGILRRIKAQMPLQKKIRLADIIIDNNGSLTKTKKQVKQIWEKL